MRVVDYADRAFEGENFEGKHASNTRVVKLELPSVSTALLLSIIIGSIEALTLFFGAGFFLNMMGISTVSLDINLLPEYLSSLLSQYIC